jgi:thioredoxin 1
MRSINMHEYENELVKSDKPVLLDFYADWCGPCQMVGPVMEELSKTYEKDIIVAKVDVDVQRELAGMFDVMSIPTVALVKDGKVVEKTVGAKPISHYKSIIDKVI